MINQKKTSGFSLMELMITVAIIGIIASIAVPSYQNSVRKSRRTDGQDALTAAAQNLEVFFARGATYPAVDSDADGIFLDEANVAGVSNEGFYNIVMLAATVACPISNCYVLAATPVGNQANDRVAAFRLNSAGQRQSSLDGATFVDGWKQP